MVKAIKSCRKCNKCFSCEKKVLNYSNRKFFDYWDIKRHNYKK